MTNRTVPGLPDAGKLHPYNHRDGTDDIVVDVIRPGDLVAVTVTVRGATLEPPPVPDAADAHSVLVAGADASLVVDFPFQHAHEEASYEATAKDRQPNPEPPDGPEGPALPTTEAVLVARKPARYRPARGSRLVFALPDGGRIDFTTAGILGALPWLDAVLHPRGEAPGTRPPRYELPSDARRGPFAGIEVALENGFFAVLRDEGVLITRRGSAGTAVPDGSSLLGRGRFAANDRLVADFIGARGVSLGRGVDRESLTGRVGDLLTPPPPAHRRASRHLQPQGDPRRDGDRGTLPPPGLPHPRRPLGARAPSRFRRTTRRVTSSCGTPASTPAPAPPRTCCDPAGRRTTRPASSAPSGPATVTPSRPRSGGTRTSTGAPGCSAPTS